MVLRLGINEWPMPGRIVRKKTYEREYHKLTEKTGIPFVPDAAWKDAVFAAAIMLAVMACALFFGPFGPTGQPDPTIIQTAPKPDFAFLWIYAVLAYLPPSLETPGHVHRARSRHRRDACCFRCSFRRRRKALVAPPGRRAHGGGHRCHPGRLHPPWHVYALEPDHGRLDQRSNPRRRPEQSHSRSNARARSSCKTSNAAIATPSAAPAACAGRRSTPSLRA
jgi:hypothetical protein